MKMEEERRGRGRNREKKGTKRNLRHHTTKQRDRREKNRFGGLRKECGQKETT